MSIDLIVFCGVRIFGCTGRTEVQGAATAICPGVCPLRSRALPEKLDLTIIPSDPVSIVETIAETLRGRPDVFLKREDLIRVSVSSGMLAAAPLDAHGIVYAIHETHRPVVEKSRGGQSEFLLIELPLESARMFLKRRDLWQFPEISGFAYAPLLRRDGTVDLTTGYDATTKTFVHHTETFPLLGSMGLNREAASVLFRMVRILFATLPFADGPKQLASDGTVVVDLTQPPGLDESVFLAALFTCIARPSLPLAPGIAIRAPAISGSGTGKGFAVRLLAEIAHGRQPHAMTAGRDGAEFDSRVAAALTTGEPMLFMDNINGRTLKSELLSQVLSEAKVATRPLGRTTTRPLETGGIVAITGNGLRLAEDLLWRFLVTDFDAGVEQAATRRFPYSTERYLEFMRASRGFVVAAALDIMSWGIRESVPAGIPMRGYADWGRMVRDPLLALGCKDPCEKNRLLTEEDPVRDVLGEFFARWAAMHGSSPVTAVTVSPEVLSVVNLSPRNRQRVAQYISNLVDTRAGGYRMTRIRHGRWGASEYVLNSVSAA